LEEVDILPNIKSAMKRVKVSAEKREENKMVKSEMKTAIKKVKIAVAAGDRELADNLYREAASCIDKAAKRGVIHKNTAANKKSGLARLVKEIA
jgi:small subunit ribosomal protein S20